MFSEIALLMSVRSAESLLGYAPTLKKMATSDNLQVRANAIETLSNLGMDNEIPIPPVRELGIGFTLHLPVDGKFRQIEKVEPFENIQDTHDYLKIISSHQYWLDFISKEAGLPKENIVHRWMALINEKCQPNQITQAYEKELQQHLKKLSLDFPFQRPRIAAVQTGLDYLLTELIDAEALDSDTIGSYTLIDPLLESKIHLQERPQFVTSISDSKSSFRGEGWVDQVDETTRKNESILTYEDNLVIGEFSYIKELAWGMPTETYSINCTISSKSNPRNNIDDNAYDCYYKEYPTIQDVSIEALTISNNSHFDFHLGFLAKWVAFNPKIAISLNWKPSKRGDFAWESTEGDLMAYSVYWKSGNVNMSSRHKGSEVAEGWYVLLTPKGKEEIKRINAKLVLKKEIVRDWFYEQKKSRRVGIEMSVEL
ncbi:MAG: hypothetical protein NTW29_18435 [Bacteroidetes bacterium]|nr:hypothetical protein [Bacteroidota bacterium]